MNLYQIDWRYKGEDDNGYRSERRYVVAATSPRAVSILATEDELFDPDDSYHVEVVTKGINVEGLC
jgi:hypothetical protein